MLAHQFCSRLAFPQPTSLISTIAIGIVHLKEANELNHFGHLSDYAVRPPKTVQITYLIRTGKIFVFYQASKSSITSFRSRVYHCFITSVLIAPLSIHPKVILTSVHRKELPFPWCQYIFIFHIKEKQCS